MKNNAIYTSEIEVKPIFSTLCSPCIICEESVELTEAEEIAARYGHFNGCKVCNKCKQAVMHVREQMQ